jgi:hypothetical protein
MNMGITEARQPEHSRGALECRLMAVRPEAANHQWRKIPPRVGNFEVDVQHQQRVGHLFGPLPPEMRNDTAFMES